MYLAAVRARPPALHLTEGYSSSARFNSLLCGAELEETPRWDCKDQFCAHSCSECWLLCWLLVKMVICYMSLGNIGLQSLLVARPDGELEANLGYRGKPHLKKEKEKRKKNAC